MDSKIFKIDNISGIYPDQMNEEDAWKIGWATARFLPSLLSGYERGQANAQSLCVGRDMRTHSKGIAKSLIKGMNAAGVNVSDLGMVDTPQMNFAINNLGTCGGVQVTGSDNPAKYSGFKISGLSAKPISTDTGLKDIRHIATALLHTKGKVTGTVEELDLTAKYKNHVLKFLRPKTKKMKIAADAFNGMAGKILPAIFNNLPVKIVPLNFEHTGKHELNPLTEKNLNNLKAATKENNCDFGVGFNSDADRLMMVDEKGNTIGCDLLTALMASYFLEKNPKSTVVYDLCGSRVVAEEIIKHGGTPRRERVGHAYMKKAMRDSHAIFGGELSGHFYYRDNYYTDSAMITLVHVINILSQADMPMSDLIKPLRRYASSGEIYFEVEDKQAKMDELARRYNDGQIDHLDGVAIGYKNWWFNCRPSQTEPLLRLNIETTNKELLEEKLSEITNHLGKPV